MFFHDKPVEPEDFFKMCPRPATVAEIGKSDLNGLAILSHIPKLVQHLVIERDCLVDSLTSFEPAYFDWVYLYTDLIGNETRQVLELLCYRVKPNGRITGSDFESMAQSITDFCAATQWKLVYVDDWNQWCLMQPGS